ncbi:MAG: prenyltransferase [Paludibacteraceae bacterium]|nr:prenyltransferase [Paludibacteraceae bacterium]
MKKWFLATRPWSFPNSVMILLVSMSYMTLLEDVNVRWTWCFAAALCMLVFHAAANLLSSYYDFKTGVDREDNAADRTLVSGAFRPRQIFTFGVILLLIGIIGGLVIAYACSPAVLVIGAIGTVLSAAYSWLKYRAWGDLTIFLNFGLLPVLGISYVAFSQFDPHLLLFSFTVGSIVVATLHANNTRDTQTDTRAGIRTFASVIGHKASVVLYCAEVLLPYAIVLVSAICFRHLFTLVVLLSLPVAIKNAKAMTRSKNDIKSIDNLDQATAMLTLQFGALLCIGYLAQYAFNTYVN